jgi:hypothetical protein
LFSTLCYARTRHYDHETFHDFPYFWRPAYAHDPVPHFLDYCYCFDWPMGRNIIDAFEDTHGLCSTSSKYPDSALYYCFSHDVFTFFFVLGDEFALLHLIFRDTKSQHSGRLWAFMSYPLPHAHMSPRICLSDFSSAIGLVYDGFRLGANMVMVGRCAGSCSCVRQIHSKYISFEIGTLLPSVISLLESLAKPTNGIMAVRCDARS